MEGMEDEAKKKRRRSKKRARLKSFLHFSKALKKLHGHGHGRSSANENPSPSPSAAAAAGSLLSACMHPRTNSFSSGVRQRHVAASNRDDDDGDGALAVNFRSLRVGPTVVPDDDDDGEDGSSTQEDYDGSESEGGGVVAGMAAKRVVSGRSGCGVAVVTLSVAPYEDFRRSMREMADAHARVEAARVGTRAAPAVDWDFMEELLFCYLQLNDRAVHKDILRAFTDTVAALRRRRRAPAPKPKSRRTRQPRRGARGSGVDDDDVDEAVDSNS